MEAKKNRISINVNVPSKKVGNIFRLILRINYRIFSKQLRWSARSV